MRAIVLAAGKGERMRPLTLTTPKPLLRAGGKPLIVHHLEHLHRAGFRDVVINHAWLGEKIEQALGNGQQFGLRLHYSREGEPLETAGGIARALPMLLDEGDDWFLVVNGDVWSDFEFSRLTPPSRGDALLVMTDNPAHHPEGDFHLDNSGLLDEDKSPKLTYTGISLLHRRLFEGLDEHSGKLGPVLRRAMRNTQVHGLYHPGQWVDVGTPERLRELDEQLQNREL
ncbi:nucleotidyltransferase family protein [Marinobacter salinisoli]|uniref:Nucleotidyltransferase family protein n=1 Tax=Marinobacter salinisoli TaxID=2769486 RepID=A0ABX7MSE6_9GAMM|nr:nucleotidyltransferase family protein [Marinobacter salinisoli]QSP95221.1 nucleotidyltransferase family protein [Marinobacter salinisoli]